MSSWGEHTCLATPNNAIGPPGDHMSSPGDYMLPPYHSAATDIEADLEPVIIHKDSNPSTPSADKLPQAKSLQVPVHTAN